ncbi:hypothetical protein [Microbacterium sp.]|uniref:hypothetical protein n=1 Tax=Microbacterium sp. TaxID=51671 RepID=UPI0037C63F0D
MNMQLNQPQHLSHPPEPPALLAPTSDRVARTSLLDRAAMRVGLWLMLWGSRPASPTDALERHRRRVFHAQQREKYEADAAYATRLWMHGA